MKKLFVYFAIVISAVVMTTSCTTDKNESDENSNVIKTKSNAPENAFGTFNGKNYVIFEESKLIVAVNEYVNENQEFKSKVPSLSFEYVNLGETDQQVLHLVAEDFENMSKTAFIIDVEKGFMSFSTKSSGLTYTGCTKGCSPRREENGDGSCTNCGPYQSGCAKTETEKSITPVIKDKTKKV